jgi:hypothetical protein
MLNETRKERKMKSLVTQDTKNREMIIRIDDDLKLRGLTSTFRVVKIDAFAIVSLRRVFEDRLEGGTPYRAHHNDIAIEGFAS